MKYLIMLPVLLITTLLHAQHAKMPLSFTKVFKDLNLDAKYQLQFHLKPSCLEADYNGDGIEDIAVMIAERKTHKQGLLVIHGGSSQYFIFGAGKSFGDTQSSNDYKWAQGWSVYKDKLAYEMLFDEDGSMSGSRKVRLRYPGIFIYDLMDNKPYAGGLIYWHDKKYVWIHQGE